MIAADTSSFRRYSTGERGHDVDAVEERCASLAHGGQFLWSRHGAAEACFSASVVALQQLRSYVKSFFYVKYFQPDPV